MSQEPSEVSAFVEQSSFIKELNERAESSHERYQEIKDLYELMADFDVTVEDNDKASHGMLVQQLASLNAAVAEAEGVVRRRSPFSLATLVCRFL